MDETLSSFCVTFSQICKINFRYHCWSSHQEIWLENRHNLRFSAQRHWILHELLRSKCLLALFYLRCSHRSVHWRIWVPPPLTAQNADFGKFGIVVGRRHDEGSVSLPPHLQGHLSFSTAFPEKKLTHFPCT